jgi:hypothetical protein
MGLDVAEDSEVFPRFLASYPFLAFPMEMARESIAEVLAGWWRT